MDRLSRSQLQGSVGRVTVDSLPREAGEGRERPAAGQMPARSMPQKETPQKETRKAPGRAMLGVGGARTARWRRSLAAPTAPRLRRTRKALATQAAPLTGGTAGRAQALSWGAGSADHHADQRGPLRAPLGRDGYLALEPSGHGLADWWRLRSPPALRRSGC